MKTKKESDERKEKIDQHDFLIAWSMGMNNYEISKKLGISRSTVREVKKDLFQNEKD